ncbi:MAG: Clp protease N-terminal domain-containing protein [Micromonosporaceae bacterium]
MFEHFEKDARRAVLEGAKEEAARRGDRRIGTDHLLLGLLHDRESRAAAALGVSLEFARAAADALDRAALASIGIDVGDRSPPAAPIKPPRRAPLTSGARAVLLGSVLEARRSKARRIRGRDLVIALLTRERPDPAAELLKALGVDPSQVRARLDESAA